MLFREDFHDATLVRRVQARDLFALDVLIQRYQRVLYSVALGMLGDPVRTRDATRSALLRTYRRVAILDSTDGFLSTSHWLLIDECLAIARRGPGTPDRRPLDDASVVSQDPDGVLGDAVAFHTLPLDERCDCARAAILRLLPEPRAIVVLRHVAGLSYEETAITLDLPTERVRARLHAGRQQLGEWLLGWPRQSRLSAGQEDLLQGHLDGALDGRLHDARESLLASRTDALARAASLRELGHLLNMLLVEPPLDLASHVLTLIAMLAER
jgi:RNA polymerase sigma-70 factor (ECF subfamily)